MSDGALPWPLSLFCKCIVSWKSFRSFIICLKATWTKECPFSQLVSRWRTLYAQRWRCEVQQASYQLNVNLGFWSMHSSLFYCSRSSDTGSPSTFARHFGADRESMLLRTAYISRCLEDEQEFFKLNLELVWCMHASLLNFSRRRARSSKKIFGGCKNVWTLNCAVGTCSTVDFAYLSSDHIFYELTRPYDMTYEDPSYHAL